MNPLPFFPPPTRAFSQQGRNPHSNSTESRGINAGSANRRIGSGSTAASGSGGHFSSLRATLSQHGLRDASSSSSSSSSSAHANHKASRPSSGSARTPSYHMTGATSAQASPGASTLNVDKIDTGGRPPHPPSELTATSDSSSISTIGASGAGSGTEASAVLQSFSPPSAGERLEAGSGSSTPRDPAPSRKPTRASTTLAAPSGRTGMNLPKGLFFDWVRSEEVAQCHALEMHAYDPEDQATKDRIKYRQSKAPHLFLGAYIPSPPPKVAGPLSVGHYSTPRRVIGFINGTASSSLSARSLAVHTVSNEEEGEEAWLVCLASIVVDESYRRKGLGLRLLEEYIMRLRRAEEGRGDQKRGLLEQPKGYECVAVLTHEETIKFFLKAGFKVQGVSHVRVGSGGWVEMRRYIKNKPAEQQEHKVQGSHDKAQIMEATSSGDRPVTTTTSDPTEAQQTEEGAIAANDAELQASQVASSAPSTPRKGSLQTAAGKKMLFDSPKAVSPPEKSASPSKPTASGPDVRSFSQSDLLAALSASSAGYAPGTNPSQPFSSILGQTLAGKTFVEDAFVALEARLVDKRKGKEGSADDKGSGGNLAEIWCPREECGCKLIRKGVALWELAESGPLTDSRLCEDSLPSGASSLPPTPQPPPAPVSHIRALKERERERAKRATKGGSDEEDNTRSTLPGAPPVGDVTTPIRPFWSLLSPMSFENIGFTKDVQWKVPLPPLSSGHHGGMIRSPSGDEEIVASPSSMTFGKPPFSGPASGVGENGFFSSNSSTTTVVADKNEAGGAGATAGSGSIHPEAPTPKRKVSRRPTFFGRKNTEKEKSQSTIASLKIQHPSDLLSANNDQHQPGSRARTPSGGGGGGGGGSGSETSSSQQQTSSQQTITIKYLICPNCDTGPLGYTIVPPSMQGGKMGLAVGEDLNGGAGAGGAGAGATSAAELQIFLLAAERVRYRFVK